MKNIYVKDILRLTNSKLIKGTEDTILKLHEIMMSYTAYESAGKYKINNNYKLINKKWMDF